MKYSFKRSSGTARALSVVFAFVLCTVFLFPAFSPADTRDESNKAWQLQKEGQELYNNSDYSGAIRSFEAALRIYRKIGDKRGAGEVFGNLGVVYDSTGDYRKAIEYYEKALALTEELGDKEGRGMHLGNLGIVYMHQGDYRKAIEYYEKALAIAGELGDKEGRGMHLGNLGSVYKYLGDYRKAIEYYGKALAVAGEFGDKRGEGLWLGNTGVIYEDLGDYRKAIEYYEKALAIAEEVGDKNGRGSRLGNLGNVYVRLGDYRKAIEYYGKALAIAEEIGDKSIKGSMFGNLGTVYMHLGDYRKAIEYTEKALAIFGEIGDKQSKQVDLGNLGNVYVHLGDYRKAIEYTEKALAIASEIGDKHGREIHLNNLGVIYYNQGDYRKAVGYYEKSLAIAEEIGDKEGKEIRLGNMGDAYLALNMDEKAFSIYTAQDDPMRLGWYYLKKKDFKEAAKQFERDRENIEKAKDSKVIPIWIGLGISLEGLKDYETAYKWYTKATGFLEDQRTALSPSEREHFFEGKEFNFPRIEAYEGAARCAFMMNRLDDAFYWAENTRGRIFSELISGKQSRASYKIPKDLAAQEEDLITRIASNKKQQEIAFEKNNPELLKRLEREYPPLKQKMDNLVDRLRREYPQYAAARYPQPVRLNQLTLKKGETIVEYEVTGPYTIGLVIRDGKVVKGFKAEKTRAELEALITRFRAPFQVDDHDRAHLEDFSLSLAKELADLLLTPALASVPKGGHLIVIPGGALNLLPFEALILSAPAAVLREEATLMAQARPGKDTGQASRRVTSIRDSGKEDPREATPAHSTAKDIVYAMDEYPISYYQSASVLSLRRGLNITRARDATLFAVGDPVFDKADTRSSGLRRVGTTASALKLEFTSEGIAGNQQTKDTGYFFPRLLNTAKEVREVGNLFSKSKLFTGPDASEANVKAEDLSGRRYLLFSTHGILGSEVPYIKQPALVLNLIGNTNEDGFLTAGEIFGLNLNADLVGLSACKTGLGVESAGEGVVGLSRAFMYAGADSVMVSLWSVSDKSTYTLMVRFFEGVKAGKTKLAAMKDAKNYLRANGYDSPFYWAPFIVIGEVE